MTRNVRTDAKLALRNVQLFDGLFDFEIERIANSMKEFSFSKGEFVFCNGDQCAGLYLLVIGQIKISIISVLGDEKVISIVQSGQIFGDAMMFMESRLSISAQALVASSVFYIPKSIIYEELEINSRLLKKMLYRMAICLHQCMNDLESYTMCSGKQRIIEFLLREISVVDFERNIATVYLPANKGVLASRLNLTQEHFSRILQDLSLEGLVFVEGRKIHVLNYNTLREKMVGLGN